jgi:putative thioredoxin
MDLPDIVTADETNFDYQVLAYSEQAPVVVNFWAQWDLTCLRTNPLLESLTEEHQGRFRLAKVNVDLNPQLTKRYQVHTVPTLKTFLNGVITNQIEGIKTDLQVINYVKKTVPGPENLLIAKASSLLRTGRYQKVEEICLEILDELPDHPPAKLLLTKALIWQEEYLEALTLLSHFPASPEYRQAELLLPLAEQLLSDTNRPGTGPDALELVYRRALDLFRRRNFQAALDGLLGIIQKDKQFQGGIPRLVALGIFELLGDDHQVTREYRPLLASSLF